MHKLGLFFLIFIVANGALLATPEAEIRERLNQWPKDLHSKNVSQVCSLFAPDLIASYPGAPERNYDQMCKHLSRVMRDPEKVFDYTSPDIEEMIVDKDIVVVRLIWTLSVLDRKSQMKEVIRERGLDVFQRQPDGSWKIRVSYAYPEPSR